MKTEWKTGHDGLRFANVGRVSVWTQPLHRSGGFRSSIGAHGVGGIVFDADEFRTADDAKAWCERRLAEFATPFVATARAEAALAEREACAEAIDAEIVALEALDDARDERGTTVVGWRINSVRTARDALRARTTPASLSTETLAAIAEARGLRVVEPEVLAGLDATALATAERERDEARAELAALRTELHKKDVQDRYWTDHGCGAAACVIERPRGMTVGGECRCGRKALRIALQRARTELAEERVDLAALTARMEIEIPSAAEAVRARAIAECVAKVESLRNDYLTEARESGCSPHRLAAATASDACGWVIVALRSLATPQHAPTEPADVDPAAGALR